MNKKILIAIHNQCSVVQNSIALNYESPNNKKLINELLKLRKSLEEFFRN